MADTIMIVDDSPDNLEVLDTLLSKNGYQVLPADSGNVALKVLHHRSADLVLLDICMPEPDGYAVCRQLKADPATCDIPVIFLSALNEPLDKVKAFEAGGVDYVSKPFNHREVLARVSVQLQLRKLQHRQQQYTAELENVVAERTEALRKRNAALHEANSALEKALEVKNEFLMLMSHEFRTPLNGILGMASLMQRELKSGHQREYVDIIEKSGWRLLNLVDNILQVAREGSAKSANAGEFPQLLDAKELCAGSLKSVATPAAAKNITLQLTADAIPLLEVPMDVSRLHQILGNLLDNAVKFTPPDCQVDVEAYYDHDTRTLVVKVADSGPGIPPADRKRIFEPFVQLANLNTRSHEGAGLGLTLVRNLLKLHGGTIKVVANDNGGSIFQAHIPAKSVAVDPENI